MAAAAMGAITRVSSEHSKPSSSEPRRVGFEWLEGAQDGGESPVGLRPGDSPLGRRALDSLRASSWALSRTFTTPSFVSHRDSFGVRVTPMARTPVNTMPKGGETASGAKASSGTSDLRTPSTAFMPSEATLRRRTGGTPIQLGDNVATSRWMLAATASLLPAGRSPVTDMQHTGWVLDPRIVKWLPRWDLLMVIALLYTAVLTPVEVAFLQEGTHINALWIVNRFVDVLFVVDIVIAFHLAFQETTQNGGHWVVNRRIIFRTYIKSWFIIDVVSVLPFWLVSLDFADPFGIRVSAMAASLASAQSGQADVTVDEAATSLSGAARASVLVRIIKLVRLLKLARMLKATRVLQRALIDVMTSQWELTYGFMRICKLFLMLIFFSHWLACLWGLASAYMHADGGRDNWIAAFEQDFAAKNNGKKPDAMDVYSASIYFSVMTLTSIGYGGFTPENTLERMLCCLYMAVAGYTWTYAIGSVAAIASNMNPHQVHYETSMDRLNIFMRSRALKPEMRMKLREYFFHSKKLQLSNDSQAILDSLSPSLKGIVALAANRKWLQRVWYFCRIFGTEGDAELIAILATRLCVRAYILNERLPVGQLYILRKGWAVKMWRFLNTGHAWGEDIIIDVPELIDHAQAVALTYLEVGTLRRRDIYAALATFPQALHIVNKAARKIKMQRLLLLFFCKVNGKAGGPKSFVPMSRAKGAGVVTEEDRLHDKIDRLVASMNRSRVSLQSESTQKKNTARDAGTAHSQSQENVTNAPTDVEEPAAEGDGSTSPKVERRHSSFYLEGRLHGQTSPTRASPTQASPLAPQHVQQQVVWESAESSEASHTLSSSSRLPSPLAPSVVACELSAAQVDTLKAAVAERGAAIAAHGLELEQRTKRLEQLEGSVSELKQMVSLMLDGLKKTGTTSS